MEKRKLGNSSLEVTPLAFGGNVFGWTADEATSFKLLDAFVAEGFNLIDTADVYSKWVPGNKGGESETIIGRWMKKTGNRHKVVIVTKVGMELSPTQKGLSKAYILKEVEESLKRLQTDYIDLYLSHKDDETTPQLETLEAYAQLIKEGKVRHIGASNFTTERLAEALLISKEHSLPHYEVLEPEYNLYDNDFQKELAPFCMQNNIGVISYFSLARGFLSGKYRSQADISKSPRGQGIAKSYFNERGFRILNALDEVAQHYNTNPATIALAWLMNQPIVTAPIASATSLDQLHQLVQSVNIKLERDSIHKLNEASKD